MQWNRSDKAASALAASMTGVVALSFGSVFVRLGSADLSPYAIAFNRLLLAAIVFGIWNGCRAAYQQLQGDPVKPIPYTFQIVLLFFSAGALWAATLASLFWALTQTNVAIAIVLHNLAPIFTSLGAWMWIGQTFDRKFRLGLGIATLGITLLELEEMQIGTSRVQGDLAAILSAVFLAAYLLIVERLRTQFAALTIQMWVCTVGMVISLPLLLITEHQIFPQSVSSWVAVLSLVCICQVLGHGFLTFSLASLSSVTVSLVHLLDPIFGSMLAWFVFGERLSLWSWGGFAVVLAGLYLTISSQVAVDMPQNELENG